MRNRIIHLWVIVFVLLKFNSSCSQTAEVECNRTVNFKKYESLLPAGFCMSEGYWAVDVHEADINNDDINDRVIKYYRKEWKCADTTFFAIYFGMKDTTFIKHRILSNLCTPMVPDFVNLEWLVKNCSDEYISQYAWQNSMWLRFEKGTIIVPFAVDLWNGLDFYFEYDKERQDWYLTKQQKWYIMDGGYERTYAPDSKIEIVNEGISIGKFRIKDYLQPW